MILSTSLPVRNIFAVLAICPAVFVVCIFAVGRMHSSMLRDEATDPVGTSDWAKEANSACPGQANGRLNTPRIRKFLLTFKILSKAAKL